MEMQFANLAGEFTLAIDSLGIFEEMINGQEARIVSGMLILLSWVA